jgi:hypothetical protein
VDFGSLVALRLQRTGLFDPLGNGCQTFGLATVGEVAVFNRRDFDVNINAVEQWTGDARTVSMNGNRGAGAGMSRVG